MNKGKAYANKKKIENRPKGDFYSTPKSLIWVAEDIIKKEFGDNEILEVAAGQDGKMPIFEELFKFCKVKWNEPFMFSNGSFDYEKDYIADENVEFLSAKYIITNPPFSIWDEFVIKAKTHCKKFMFIGRLNYFGTNERYQNGLFKNLKAVYPFNRYVDYQTPYRKDGLFHVGAMATAWFLWDMDYTETTIMKQLDVQPYAKLGAFRK